MSSLARKPIQVYLRSEQIDRLRYLAARREVSVAQLVREGVDRLLGEVPPEEDPLLDIIGVVEGGPSDASERHDDYLAEMVMEENR